jgi:uncharacterized protein (DUF433 family)
MNPQDNKAIEAVMARTRYITSDESIFDGAPVIRGTRIPVDRLMALWDKGYEVDQISEEFSGLSKRIIRGAIGELSSLGQTVFAERIGSRKKKS